LSLVLECEINLSTMHSNFGRENRGHSLVVLSEVKTDNAQSRGMLHVPRGNRKDWKLINRPAEIGLLK